MRYVVSFLLTSALALSAVPAGADAPIRSLDYQVSGVVNGDRHQAEVRVDFIAGHADGVFHLEVGEVADGRTRFDAEVDVAHDGSIWTDSPRSLTMEEEALISSLALESENMTGVDRGDHWDREGSTAGGRQQTHYVVKQVGDDGYVVLAVTREVTRPDGAVWHWDGTMLYDVDAVVPASLSLSGRRDVDGQTVALTATLARDSFKRPAQP